jgi:hypothetical protein
MLFSSTENVVLRYCLQKHLRSSGPEAPRTHQLFFVIEPQHSGADELYERLKKEFQDLTTVNATTSPDGIINTLFPPTNEKVPAGPAFLECSPVTIGQWNILKEGSKNGDDPQLWQPKKSLVIKVTSAKGLVEKRRRRQV